MNKPEYWKNRKAGKRGQGPYPNPVVRVWLPDEWDIEKKRLAMVLFNDNTKD